MVNVLILSPLLPALLLILDGPSGTTAFSTPTVSYSRTVNTNTRLHAQKQKTAKKEKKNKYEDVENEPELPISISPGLPPALTLSGLTCSHDGGTVFQLRDVNYVLARNAKVGLVGRNGCGKSSLMKILAESCCTDLDPASFSSEEGVRFTGTVECPREVRVAFVEQEPPMSSDVTVGNSLLGIVSSTSNGMVGGPSKSVYAAVRRYAHAVSALEYDEDEFSAATAEMDSRDGWAVLTKADEIATRLRLDHLSDMPLSKLSGGERKRVALGAALVQQPDVLLLDEPTNHLDLAAIRLLSDLIAEEKKMTLLTITHDRAFLNEVCDRMLELDNGSLYGYTGNYGDYLEGKEARLILEDKEMSTTKKKFSRELAWMRKQPSARQAKSKARQEAFYKLEKMTKPRAVDPNLVLTNDARRIGGNILKLKNVSKQFGDRLMLDDFSYDFNAGDTIGIVGANGVGKSTFLKILTGALEADSGVVEKGETVVFGVYEQMGISLDENQRVLDFVKQRVLARDGSTLAEAPGECMKLLKQFQFPKEKWNDEILKLSGGERRRLQLLAVLTQRPNFLILDEPTNDVDLDTLSALEDYLAEFNGVLVIVSHDRFFVDKVTEHLFVFEGDGVVKDYLGSLSDYAETLIDDEKASKRK